MFAVVEILAAGGPEAVEETILVPAAGGLGYKDCPENGGNDDAVVENWVVAGQRVEVVEDDYAGDAGDAADNVWGVADVGKVAEAKSSDFRSSEKPAMEAQAAIE